MLSRYRCESGIAIFEKRVTWNYANSPFQQEKEYQKQEDAWMHAINF